MRKRNQEDEKSKKRMRAEEAPEEIAEEAPTQDISEQNREDSNTSFLYRLSILTAALSSFVRLLRVPIYGRDSTEERQPERETSARPEESEESVEAFNEALSASMARIRRGEETQRVNVNVLQEDLRRRISDMIWAVANRHLSPNGEREEASDVFSSQLFPQDVEHLIQQIPPSAHSHDPTSIFFTVVYYYIEDDAPQRKTIDKEELDKTCPEKKIEVPQGECSICLQSFEPEEISRTLACKHIFHSSCISEWLLHYADECPMCRTSASHVE